jgi:hypothetical protein
MKPQKFKKSKKKAIKKNEKKAFLKLKMKFTFAFVDHPLKVDYLTFLLHLQIHLLQQ